MSSSYSDFNSRVPPSFRGNQWISLEEYERRKAKEGLPKISEMNAQLILDLLEKGEKLDADETRDAMIIAVKEDSVELAEKIGFSEESLCEYKLPNNRYEDPKRLPSCALKAALENRSLKILPLIFKKIKNFSGIAEELKMLFDGLKQGFKRGDEEFVSLLASCFMRDHFLLRTQEYPSCLQECISFARDHISEKKNLDMLSDMISLDNPLWLQGIFKPENPLFTKGENIIFQEAIALGKEGVARLLLVAQTTSSSELEASKRELLHIALQNGKLYLSIFLFTSLADPVADEFCTSAEQGGALDFLRLCCFEDQGRLFFETPMSAVEHDNASVMRYFSRLHCIEFLESLLHKALIFKKHSVTKALLEDANLNSGWALKWAIMDEELEAICSLNNYDALLIKKTSALFIAVQEKKAKAVDTLLELGAELSQIDREGNTCFHLIARDQRHAIKEKGALLKRLSQVDLDEGTKICNWVNSSHLRFCDYLNEKEFESYKDHFLDNGYDYVDGHMDIVGELPVKLSAIIADFCSTEDLASLTCVSQVWCKVFSCQFDRMMYPFQHMIVERKFGKPGKMRINRSVRIHGAVRSMGALSNRLLAVVKQPTSTERKCHRLISLAIAGAQPFQKDKEGNTCFHLIARDQKYTIEEKGALLKRLSQVDLDEGTKICNWVNSSHLRFCDYLNKKEFESYKDHFLGNGYDYVDGHMDIIGMLPSELSLMFLRNWSIDALTKFSVVSRAWHSTLSYQFDRIMYPYRHRSIERALSSTGENQVERQVEVHGKYRTMKELSDRLLTVAKEPTSTERKCDRLISLIIAGANHLHQDEKGNPFWKLLSQEEFDFIKKSFMWTAESQDNTVLAELVALWETS